MKLAAPISLVFGVCALQGANAGVILVLPAPTSFPPAPSFSSISLPSISLPSGFSLPSLSIPTSFSIPTGSFSIPIPTSFPSASLSTVSETAFASVSIGGVASADGATTYFLEYVEGVNGVTRTFTEQPFAQGATVWRDDQLHETCSLDGKGIAVCNIANETSFTGTAMPIFTVGANNPGIGGGGLGGGSGSGSGGGSTGGALRVNGGASVGWMLVGSVAAMVAGMRLVL
ncbi:hypothetical protein K438DRAFT_1988268 [Mycena galopus ATCC 62051]|nr:hypothetical protein K438DRAFT_1988268 [Mycena galopus ATCC 62051]